MPLIKNSLKKVAFKLFENEINKIHLLKDIHLGQSCYIFGDGISIKYFDLNLFRDKISIPVSYIPYHKDFKLLNTKYCILGEPWYFYPYFKTTTPPIHWWKNDIQKEYRKLIKNNPDIKFFLNLSNYPVIREKNIFFTFKNFNDKRLPSDFITTKLNAFDGSIRSSITLATYLGFKDIYLVGFDYTHNPGKALHWYEKGHGIDINFEDYNKDFFDKMRDYVNITTITINSKSNCCNSITYEEFTGKKPNFQENNELLKPNLMQLLNTWPDYKIF